MMLPCKPLVRTAEFYIQRLGITFQTWLGDPERLELKLKSSIRVASLLKNNGQEEI